MEKRLEEFSKNPMIKKKALPLVPLRGKVAFPHTTISFEVGRENTLKASERDSSSVDKFVFICSQKDPTKVEFTDEDLYEYGEISIVSGNSLLKVLFRYSKKFPC